jgi:predicted SprT family Zn-dependent metalloprotease
VDELARKLREHQEAHPQVGGLYRALHTFADRLIEHHFSHLDMPQLALSIEKDRRNKLGHYRPFDGYMMVHTINLNISTMKDGEEAAETLAHEIVHLWQVVDGHPCKKNHHGEDFHAMMAQIGIETRGPLGHHVSRTATWLNWMEENADLNLAAFTLPGVNQRARRQLNLFRCQCEGGNPVRSRKMLDIYCHDCGCDYEYVPISQRRRSGPSRS